MTRKATALFIPALVVPALAGCAPAPTPQSTPQGNYAPYDPEANPYCGVFGSCEPAVTHPYPIPSNH